MTRKGAPLPFQLRISGGQEGKANDTSPFERSFTCTHPVPVGFPNLGDHHLS